MKKVFKSFTIYTSANFFNQAIPFLLLPILTRFLSPKDYGMLATFMALIGIINVVVSMGNTGAVVRSYFDREKKDFVFSKYTFNAIFINFIVFLIVLIVVWRLKSFISQQFLIPEDWLLLLPVIGLCAAIFYITEKLFVFRQKPVAYASLKIASTFIEVMLSILFVVVLSLDWRGRVLGITFDKIIFLIFGILYFIRNKFLIFSISYKYIKDIFEFGVPVVFHSLGITIVAAIDRFFLNKLVGLSATGIYGVSYSTASIIAFLVAAFNLAWSPFLYEKLGKITEAIKIKLVKFTYLYFISIIAIAMLFIFAAPRFLKFFVGKDFLGASQFIFWLALGYAVHGMYVMMVDYIFYQKKTYLLSIIAVIIVFLSIIFNYLLIKSNGAIGAAQATFLTFFVRFILVWYFSNKVYPMPWFSFAKLLKIKTL